MTTDLNAAELMRSIGEAARRASRSMARARTAEKNAALRRLAELLIEERAAVEAANAKDLENARAEGLSPAFIDRLTISGPVLERMAEGVLQIAELADPIGGVSDMRAMPSGIQVGRMRVPLGVIAMIFESRPNVTIDAAALGLKSGNAVILRGGHEALESNLALAKLVARALAESGLPEAAVQLIPTSDRAVVGELIRARDYVDVLIPRGGKGLISRLMKEATVPMIKHLNGICHTYVDEVVDLEMALSVTDNAKTQRPSPCNATETLLVHEKQAEAFLPRIGRVWTEKKVEMRCDAKALEILTKAGIPAVPATDEDWDTEYNDLVISIAVVPSLDAAIDFIDAHSSRHTDAILTDSVSAADRFLREVDSSSVMVNASTRFADGFEYGLGAEIGISTDRLHARGPVGLEGLTSLKYIVLGHGEGRH
ncbi:glutamate-5-semialdehyde dehydrogenase [Sutterella sp.]|uniref:glutamate-5-semialdehyde dehydrogenase n=1 Tax=Sutterella sp. TaxID=1981025 RepID=UPI0026DF5C72|nr:glutamate-5-semialdehyde dehydrogenase [Sutterella sp.]MDO5531931.1 glutamate-5-semialdehyde dehydrogenase [Sutterella sp.]